VSHTWAPIGCQRPILALVTNRHLLPEPKSESLLDLVTRAANAGVDLVHLRERDLPDLELLHLTRAACAAVAGSATRVVVNERADIALAGGAHGVHLRADSAPASRARAAGVLVIGRSVHSEEEVRIAIDDGACDYLMFGTIFPSVSKAPGHPTVGLDALRRVCEVSHRPVLAIGGIDVANARSVAATGAAGLAAIGLFAGARSLPELVYSLRRSFDT
jgi:thiamine-phosphate pyrophosphorylase